VTKSFSKDIWALQDELGDAAHPILDLLANCIQRLKNYGWDDSLPVKPYGLFGDSYSYAISPDYCFTFKSVTDRDERKSPITEHYHLKNLLRSR
jgi:hypothetical protein